jgi:hypothetical protein
MHIHSSFSEQEGSMDAQLYQAALNAIDVLWWTDHDHRMDGLDYRQTVHFTSFNETGGPGQGGAWSWATVESGSNTSASTGSIVQTPSSPNDTVSGGSLYLAAESSTGSPAKFGFYANSHPAGWNYRDNLTGQSLLIDVLLAGGWSKGYLELLINTSFHEAAGGLPAGYYTLSYRFVQEGQSSSVANGTNGVITIPVTTPWQTVTITPANDIQALWPSLDYRDFALWELTLDAVSTGDLVQGYFDFLRFDRTVSGQSFFNEQAEMGTALSSKYPSVSQQQGLEVSAWYPHINWFGPNVTVPTYSGISYSSYSSYLQNTLIPSIHQSGGLTSYNHPYGANDGPLLSQSEQNAKLAQVAAQLLPTLALGSDLIEVGYKLRGSCDLEHHLALWDIMSRNGVFLTGNGTSDDHHAQNWRGIGNNWVTWVWATSMAQTDLLAALAAGRAWCGSLSQFNGSLDLLIDSQVPMGAVSVSQVTSRQLTATALGLPTGSSLQVMRGVVDYAGKAQLTDDVKVVSSYSASNISGGQVSLNIDTSSSCFVRAQLLSSRGAIIATSNPIWLLRSQPPNGIPTPRQS